MGLQPLEFADCLTDSPFFREKLHEHERELERTSKSIKQLVNDGKELLNAARCLSKAQKTFSNNLMEFKFECIGTQQTDDEVLIAASLKEFGKLIAAIEDERDRMLAKATESFIRPLETFRKEHIGTAKEGKKKFDKQTSKFCASLERYLNLKTKINDNTLQEADAALGMERRHFYQASMQYVLLLQEVQERKKFEFVEILLSFMYSWLNFYHQGHEVGRDVMPYMTDLQLKLQKTRNSYDSTRLEAEQLMTKMLEVRGTKPVDQTGVLRGITRQGYLYLMEKKAISTTWTKYYCQYKKEEKEFMMYPYNQVGGKLISKDRLVVKSCSRKHADAYEKRFCFEITVGERTLILQGLSDEDRKSWMDAMDGKEPIYNLPQKTTDDTLLDDIGFTFIKKCLSAIENRGILDQGLYRVVGVNSKVIKLTSMGLDRRKSDKLMLEEPGEWEVKTITSAVKNYLRSLPEPLMTFKLHEKLILAAKQESKTLRIHDIHAIIHKLPEPNFEMLEILIEHLKKVASKSDVNLMTVANLGVCFGPTFMRPEEETMASIMEIKFCNIVIEIIANNFEKIFKTPPEDADISDMRVAPDKGYLEAHRPPAATNHSTISQLVPNHARPNYPTMGSTKPPPPPKAPQYANQAMMQQPPPKGPNHSFAAARGRLRPVGIYNPSIGDYDTPHTGSSTSGSSDSLNSIKAASNHLSGHPSTTSPLPDQNRRPSAPVYSSMCNSFGTPTALTGSASSSPRLQGNRRVQNQPVYSNLNSSGNRFTFNMGSDPPTFGSVKKRTSADPAVPSMNSSVTSMGSSVTSVSSSSSNKTPRRMVRTLYHCDSENETELSFEPNEIILNVRPSREPGWLEGSLNGKVGLIPENYVEYVEQ